MKLPLKSLLIPTSILALVLSAACSEDASKGDDDDDTPGTGGTAGSGSSGDVLLVPSDMGWVDREDVGNDIEVQGSWYPYGDQYGEPPSGAKCTNIGMHVGGQVAPPAECSIIETPPPPPAMGFPNTGGNMCTKGTTAMILPCPTGLTTSGCPSKDYSNMWGAGIGFDFNANKGPPDGDGAKNTWNPATYGIVGISFEIDQVPPTKLRVEFPIRLTDEEATAAGLPSGATTDDHPDGAPYWGASSSFPPSNVIPGVNRVLWTDVKPPRTNYEYKPEKMVGIQFHALAIDGTSRGTYEFCVKNLKFLRQ